MLATLALAIAAPATAFYIHTQTYRHPTDPGSSRLGQQRAARDHDPLRGQLCRRHQQVDLGPGALGLHHIASRQPAA